MEENPLEDYKNDELGIFIETHLLQDENILECIKKTQIEINDENWLEYIYNNTFMLIGGLKNNEILANYEGENQAKKSVRLIIQALEKGIVKYYDTEELKAVKENLLTPKYQKEIKVIKRNHVLNKIVSYCLIALLLAVV